MFQFSGCPPVSLWIHDTVAGGLPAGFPHSDIRGSRLICSSPRLFAAYHVFLRLLVPRHPSCALVGLTCSCHTSVYGFCFFSSFLSLHRSRLSRLTDIFLRHLWFRSVFCFQGAKVLSINKLCFFLSVLPSAGQPSRNRIVIFYSSSWRWRDSNS